MQENRTDLHPTLFPEKTARDLLRRLVHGSPSQKSLAVELFGAEHLNQSYSRLSKTLQPDPPTFFDIDWIVPALEVLGETAAHEFLAWLCAELGYEAPRVKREISVEERLTALEDAAAEDERELAALLDRRRKRADEAAKLRSASRKGRR